MQVRMMQKRAKLAKVVQREESHQRELEQNDAVFF